MTKKRENCGTDKNIVTKHVVINSPTSAQLLSITADEKAIDKMIISFNRIMPKWNSWINSSFLSDELKQKYMDLITQRMKYLMGE